jgi:hypothetical protein
MLAAAGTFVPEHFIKMFMERWAEDATYFCWQHVPPRGLDVWQFWARLMQSGTAFQPGTSSSGKSSSCCCFCALLLSSTLSP